MTESADPQMALMFSFFEGLVQKGPGSKESTLKALSMLDDLPPRPRIVDFGCGSGVASLVLAKAMDCTVTAVEVHQPFLNELRAIAARDGLADRITTVEALLKDKEKLTAILTYHVVPGKVMAKDVVKLSSAKTANGQALSIRTKNGTVMIDNAKVVKADIPCSNGVIHVIDTVVLPKAS